MQINSDEESNLQNGKRTATTSAVTVDFINDQGKDPQFLSKK